MTQKAITGLSCPSCGGTLEIREGRRTVECSFCGTGSMLTGEAGLLRYYVKDEITRDQVKRATFKWLQSPDKAPDLQKTYKVEELFLIYVPFFRVRTQALGWILGKVEVSAEKGRKEFRNVERKIDGIFDWNAPACEMGEFGVDWINLEGDTLRPFVLDEVQPRGMVFDPTMSFQDFGKKTMYKFEDYARDESGVDLVTFNKIHYLNLEKAVVYYPLWVFRYRYGNRTYQIVYDAQDGSMLSGNAPGNNLFRVLALMGSMFLSMLLFTTSLRSEAVPLTFLTFIMVLFSLYFGHKKFRYGSEVIYRLTSGGPRGSHQKILSSKITVNFLLDKLKNI